jgi:hypothetical protein
LGDDPVLVLSLIPMRLHRSSLSKVENKRSGLSVPVGFDGDFTVVSVRVGLAVFLLRVGPGELLHPEPPQMRA